MRAFHHMVRHNPEVLRDLLDGIPPEVNFRRVVPQGWERATFGSASRSRSGSMVPPRNVVRRSRSPREQKKSEKESH